MSDDGTFAANVIALVTISAVVARMILARAWYAPTLRRQLITAGAILLVCLVGMGRRFGVDDAVMDGLSGYAWTTVAAAYFYKLTTMRSDLEQQQAPTRTDHRE